MKLRWSLAPLAVAAGLAFAPGALAAPADGPTATAAGGDVPPLTPAVVNVPIIRTDKAITKAADSVDQNYPVRASNSLAAARKYLTRSFLGAQYLVANTPPVDPEAEDASAARTRAFRTLARQEVRASRHARAHHGWVVAHKSGDAAGPVFADPPTAVFSVFTSQYDAATQTIGMLNDATGTTLDRVATTLAKVTNLRGRLADYIHTNAPPADPEAEGEVATFDTVMPGVTILLGDEITQLQAAAADRTLPAAAQAAITAALAADQALVTNLNTWYPPVVED